MNIQCSRIPDFVRLVTEEGIIQAKQEKESFSYDDVKLTCSKEGDDIGIHLTAGHTPVRFIILRFNGSLKNKCRILGDAFERSYGNLEWRGINPQRIMPWYMLLSDGNESTGIGVKVRPNAMAFWMCDAQGITLWLDVRSGAKGVILSGKELKAATIVQLESEKDENPFSFAKRFCKTLCTDPILPKAPVYGSNNWYYAYGNSSEEEVLSDTSLLAELTEGLENRPYMVIDDCWQELALTKGAAGRPYERGNKKFPDMAGLAQKMKQTGVKPGIWIRPLETNESFLSEEVRGLRNRNTLDPTVPGALKLIAEDMRRVTGWGYELVKYDFATFDFYGGFYPEAIDVLKADGWTLHDRSQTSAEAIKALYKTLHDNAGDAVVIGCNVIGHLAAGFIHLHRSGDDTSGNSFDRSVMMGVNTLAFRLPQHKAFFHMDADCVGITENIPWELNKRFLELLAKSGTPLFVSVKPSVITEEIKQDLKAAFKKASEQKEEMEPLDWFDTVIPSEYKVDGKLIKFDWIGEQGLEKYCSL